MTAETATERGADWKSSACILCECNCGILVKLGGEDARRFEQIRGDKAHQASKGYSWQKALRSRLIPRELDEPKAIKLSAGGEETGARTCDLRSPSLSSVPTVSSILVASGRTWRGPRRSASRVPGRWSRRSARCLS